PRGRWEGSPARPSRATGGDRRSDCVPVLGPGLVRDGCRLERGWGHCPDHRLAELCGNRSEVGAARAQSRDTDAGSVDREGGGKRTPPLTRVGVRAQAVSRAKALGATLPGSAASIGGMPELAGRTADAFEAGIREHEE